MDSSYTTKRNGRPKHQNLYIKLKVVAVACGKAFCIEFYIFLRLLSHRCHDDAENTNRPAVATAESFRFSVFFPNIMQHSIKFHLISLLKWMQRAHIISYNRIKGIQLVEPKELYGKLIIRHYYYICADSIQSDILWIK